eukprot:TRINITY_DN4535_c0_g1_i1.p1 TRINITY_DN4535_c0_g1~~TRINITY_DN4535_c0_g1_i1.p1  ORF type:complete len:87 (-),score=25.28 TRINITY_DN4535_c0_g1_i1:131-391(-)
MLTEILNKGELRESFSLCQHIRIKIASANREMGITETKGISLKPQALSSVDSNSSLLSSESCSSFEIDSRFSDDLNIEFDDVYELQ